MSNFPVLALKNKPQPQKPSDRAWWKSATVYQVYPASFADHADNGHGTILGIKSRVPYLKELGVDVVWLSPLYKSPQADMGYDISDYETPDPRYGTLQDWEALRDEVHKHGMRLVMDLVINHSSEEVGPALRPKLMSSTRGSSSPSRPSPTPSGTGTSGETHASSAARSSRQTTGTRSLGPWEYDEASDQYYLHTFLKEQPDLNWENPELRKELWRMMRVWLDRGADGFRMDVINFIGKHPEYPDAPILLPGRDFQPFGDLSINRKVVHEYLKEMYQEVLVDYDCFWYVPPKALLTPSVGECPGGEPVEAYAGYSKPANKELQMIFHFHHQGFDRGAGGFGRVSNMDWKMADFKEVFNHWNVGMEANGGWNSNYMENHDQPRTISRIASDHPDDRAHCAKLLAMFQCSLTGTIFVYQGQEIGLCNVPRDWGVEEYKDIETIQHLEGETEYRKRNGEDEDLAGLLKEMRETARDNGRTPMQWDTTENAGFSKGTPWMRVHDDYAQGWNVAQQLKDDDSPFKFWQRMLALRKEYEALVYGVFKPFDSPEDIYAYTRTDPTISQTLLVVLNFTKGSDRRGQAASFEIPKNVGVSKAKLVISNNEQGLKEGTGIEGGKIELGKYEGRVYVL